MSKEVSEIKPNYAPVYAAALYPDLAKVFQEHGYALAVHGSLARDFDLIAVPWAPYVSQPKSILDEITKHFYIRIVGESEIKNHGRVAYKISVGHGCCALDLSFLPVMEMSA